MVVGTAGTFIAFSERLCERMRDFGAEMPRSITLRLFLWVEVIESH